MQCSCGTDNAPNAKFCKKCGAPVQTVSVVTEEQFKSCPGCTAQLKPNAKFCGKCGHKFNDTASTPQSDLQELKPQTVAPTEQVMNEPVAIETVASVAYVNPVDVVKTQPGDPDPVQPAKVEKVTANVTALPAVEATVTSGGNKKIIVIAAVLFVVAAVAGAGWYFILAPKNEVATIEMAEVHADVAAPVVSPVTDAPVTVNVSSTASYLGKTAKVGQILGGHTMEPVDQTKNFKILQGFDDNGHKLILVTDMAGKVVDAKNIPEIDKAFISSKQACVLNKKPYAGVYVASSFEKLAQPSSIWKLAENGKLVEETVANLECAAYSECEPESDVCFNVGYNDKHKQELAKQPAAKQAIAKPKVQAKKEPVQESAPSNATQHHEQSAPATITTEPAPTQQQEVTQEEPKKKTKGFNRFLEKFGESVKKGATETTCTDAQRALNQCN